MSWRTGCAVLLSCLTCAWCADTSDNTSSHLAMGRLDWMNFNRPQALQHFSAGFAEAPNHSGVLREYAAVTPDRALEAALLRRLLESDAASPMAKLEAQERLTLLARLGGRLVHRLESPYMSFEIHMPVAYSRDSRPAGWVLSVRLNEGRALRLMLDTGSRGILISSATARKLQLEQLGDTILGGFGDRGNRRGGYRLADRLEVGGIRYSNVIVESGEIELPADLDGVLGLDLFRHFLITLDGPRKLLHLKPYDGADPIEAEGERPWSSHSSEVGGTLMQSGHLLIATAVLDSGAPARFVLDSGAAYSLLHPRAQAIALRKVSLQGLSGFVAADEAQPVALQLGRVRVVLYEAVITDLSPVSEHFGVQIDGFIGFPVLHRRVTTIDLRSGRLQMR